jgi:hypothetical protein
MKTELRKFVLQTIIIAVLIILTILFLQFFNVIQYSVQPVFFIVPFIMLVTVAFHTYLIYTAKKGDRMFISKYIASSGLKLMLYLAAILIYIFSKGVNIKFVMIIFLITYIIYSFIEVYSIIKYLKK